MGQACCGGFTRRIRGGRRQYRHNKAHDFAPKRSWKYKDANLLSSEDDFEEGGDLGLGMGLGTGTPSSHSGHQQLPQGDSVDLQEDSLGPNRTRTGLLSFRNDSITSSSSEGEGQGFKTTPIHVPTSTSPPLVEDKGRARTESNVSEQIGRFEVMDVEEDSNRRLISTSSAETSKLLATPTDNGNGTASLTEVPQVLP